MRGAESIGPKITRHQAKGAVGGWMRIYSVPISNYAIEIKRGRWCAARFYLFGGDRIHSVQKITRSKEEGAFGGRGLDYPTPGENYTLKRERAVGAPRAFFYLL